MKNLKQANVNVTLKSLFRYWLEITTPFHKLTAQQQHTLAAFLHEHYIMKQQITNEKILWKMVFDYDVKARVAKELGTNEQVIRNNITKFRKKGIIQNGRIVGTYIPNLEKDATSFKVLFNFNIV